MGRGQALIWLICNRQGRYAGLVLWFIILRGAGGGGFRDNFMFFVQITTVWQHALTNPDSQNTRYTQLPSQEMALASL